MTLIDKISTAVFVIAFCLITPSLGTAAQTGGLSTYWLEIATHGAGAFGSEWRTLVIARNLGSSTAEVTIVLHTTGGDYQFQDTISAGVQKAWDDLVGLMGVEGKGALEVRSSQPLNVVGRIYNTSAAGTFGQFLNGLPAGSGAAAGEDAWLLGLRQESGLYRTNLSVTNTGNSAATVRVTLFATDGADLGSFNLNLDPGEVIQDSEPFRNRVGAADLGWGFARVAVTAGAGVLTSASVIDSQSNDATTIAMKRPGCSPGGENGWLEIASHGAGFFGSEWRTVAVARNIGDATAVVTLVLHTSFGDHEMTYTIPVGAQGVFDDLVGAMGIDGKGAVEIRSSQPLDVIGRAYNQADEGTYGQFLEGSTSSAGLGRNEVAWLLGLRQEEGVYRSNLSVTNTGSVTARVEVTLYDEFGSQLHTYVLEPRPGEVIQDGEPFRARATRPNLGFGFARVEVKEGSGVLTSASVIDSRTNDATTIAMKAEDRRAGCAPEPPQIVLAAATDADELTVAWTAVADDTTPLAQMSYAVHLSTEEGFEPGPSSLAAAATGEAQVVIRGLAGGTEYYVVVVAIDEDGNRTRSRGSWSARTLDVVPVQRMGAIVQTAESLGLGKATASGTDLVFPRQSSSQLPAVGAVLIGPFAGGGGFVRSVVGVGQTANEISVATTEGFLEDGYEQFQLLSSGSLIDLEGEGKTRAAGDESWGRPMVWDGHLLSIETVRHAGSGPGLEYRPRERSGVTEAKIGDLGEITLEAGVDFTPELFTNATLTANGLETAEVIARGSLGVSVLAQYEWSAAAEYEQEVPIFTTTWLATYLVGAVPVYQTITLDVTALVTAAASAEVSAQTAVSAEAEVEVGVSYTNAGGWQPVSNMDFSRSMSADLSVVGGVEAEVRLIPKLTVEFYEFVAAWITVEPSLSGVIEGQGTLMTSCAPLQITAFDFDLGVKANVGVDTTFIKTVTWFDATVWESPAWVLFSLPQFEGIEAGGPGPVQLVASVEDGTNNPFDPGSAGWYVSPTTATIVSDGDPTQATLTCAEDREYTVTFSGHGRLGELGRRCLQLDVGCEPEVVTEAPQDAPAVTAAAISESAVNVSWTTVAGADGYRLYRGGTQIYSGPSRSYSDTGLESNMQYCYTARAFNSAGNGPMSSRSCATTDDLIEPPQDVPVVTATTVSDSSIDLSWTAVSGASGYRLYRGATEVYNGLSRTYSDTDLEPDTQHCYTARAYNSAGEGPLSSQSCAMTESGSGNDDEITIMLPGDVPLVLVRIPAGTFMMGSPDDERGRYNNEDLHQVTLTLDYYLGKYEVTRDQWEAISWGGAPGLGPDYPVSLASWDLICGGTTGFDCSPDSFIGRLNSYVGTNAFRLPTEAEWERAARAGTQTAFSFDTSSNPEWDYQCGDFPDAEPYMWWCGNSPLIEPVGTKLPNAFGLHDMHGNSMEWVADWYSFELGTEPQVDPKGPSTGIYRVARSRGWWSEWDAYADSCRSAYREPVDPGEAGWHLGFRVAMSP